MSQRLTKETLVYIYNNNSVERTCKILKLNYETLEKYLKMYGVRMKKGQRKGTKTDRDKVTIFNAEFHKKHGFYPDVRIIAKKLRFPKIKVTEIMSAYDCKGLEDPEVFTMQKIRLHESFLNEIKAYSKKEGLTINEAFKSWTYNYSKGNFKRLFVGKGEIDGK